jgi:hypothetical protein
MHSSHLLREGARPEVVRDILGHANIEVTQNVYGKGALTRQFTAHKQRCSRIAPDCHLNSGTFPNEMLPVFVTGRVFWVHSA